MELLMSTVLPNITLPNVLHERLETLAARFGIGEESAPVVTVRNNTHTAEPPSGKDAPMATQSPTNVVVLSRPRPTTADRNRAAEAFALSLECAAVGDIASEEAALRTALDAMPDDPAANINYGNRMYNSGRFQEALACYNTAVGTASANVLALFNRGNVLEELGFFAEAIADWTAAVTLAPDYGDAHYNLARALSRDGRRREALLHWTKYLALDRASAWASRARHERKKLLKLEPLQIVSRKIA
jgi:tetratricopeptide (TPR) repeat protein